MKKVTALLLLIAALTLPALAQVPAGDTTGTALTIAIPCALTAAGTNQFGIIWRYEVKAAKAAWTAATNANPYHATSNAPPVIPSFAAWIREAIAPAFPKQYNAIVQNYNWQRRRDAMQAAEQAALLELATEAFWLQTPAAQAAQSNAWRTALNAVAP